MDHRSQPPLTAQQISEGWLEADTPPHGLSPPQKDGGLAQWATAGGASVALPDHLTTGIASPVRAVAATLTLLKLDPNNTIITDLVRLASADLANQPNISTELLALHAAFKWPHVVTEKILNGFVHIDGGGCTPGLWVQIEEVQV
jgi:L-alanine-DL-glutamate epimerase-like enolase superfamily enzyme